jgi:hypothetical protein
VIIRGDEQLGDLGLSFSDVGKGLKRGAKATGGAVVKGAKAVGGAVAKGAGAVFSAPGAAASFAYGGAKKVAGAVKPPWEGVGFGKPGWATRLARNVAKMGINPAGVMCSTRRYADSGFCRAYGAVSWEVTKQIVSKVYQVDVNAIESAANRVTWAPTEAERAAARAELKRYPPDVVALVEARNKAPSWWEDFIEWLGIA